MIDSVECSVDSRGKPAPNGARGGGTRPRNLWARLALAIAGAGLAGIAYGAAELGITKVTSNPTPTAGGAAFSYTLTVTNSGASDALNVVVVDPLPPGVIFYNVAVVNNPSVAGYSLICSGPPYATNGTVTCTGTLPAAVGANNSTSTITIVAGMSANLASQVRTNTATVISNTQEITPNVAPNTASVQQNIQVSAPLTIGISGPASITRGSNAVYTITVNNSGPSTALNATFTDALPAYTSFVSMYGTKSLHDGCTVNPSNVITCAAVDLPAGLSALTVVVRTSPVTPLGNLANNATITAAGTGSIVVGTATTTATVNP